MSSALAEPAPKENKAVDSLGAGASPMNISLPDRGDEAWRFADRSELAGFANLERASPLDATGANTLVERSAFAEETAASFVFANGCLVHSTTTSLPDGVSVLSYSTALSERPELLADHDLREGDSLGSSTFLDALRSAGSDGVVVSVADGVSLDRPIEVFHWLSGGGTTFPRTLVVAGRNARVSVVEHFCSDDAGYVVGGAEVVAGDGSHVHYAGIQKLATEARAIQVGSLTAGRDAHIENLVLNLGGAWVRNEWTSHLNAPGGHCDMLSINVASRDQSFDQRTLQLHHAPNTTSDLLYKNALYDRSKSVFAGLIVVDDGAHHTDAYQTCRNLLLSDECEANSMPGLEINADQVKCSHGSTSGQIDESELFYLLARGIPERTARHLIAVGFTQEVVGRIADERVVATVAAALEQGFDSIGR